MNTEKKCRKGTLQWEQNLSLQARKLWSLQGRWFYLSPSSWLFNPSLSSPVTCSRKAFPCLLQLPLLQVCLLQPHSTPALPSFFVSHREKRQFSNPKSAQQNDAALSTHRDIWEQCTAHCIQPPPEDGAFLILPTVEQDTGWLFLLTLSIGSHINIWGQSWASHTGAESRAMAGWYGPGKDNGNPEIYFSTELEQHSALDCSMPETSWDFCVELLAIQHLCMPNPTSFLLQQLTE